MVLWDYRALSSAVKQTLSLMMKAYLGARDASRLESLQLLLFFGVMVVVTLLVCDVSVVGGGMVVVMMW